MTSRIIIFSDESAKNGKYYSNFYGAGLVLSEHFYQVDRELRLKIQDLGLLDEIKWNNISHSNHERYIQLVSTIFELVNQSLLKFRIMFTHNTHRPIGLTKEHRKSAYFILYYQFIKHGLGLRYYDQSLGERDLQLICDQFPANREEIVEFKNFLMRLNKSGFNQAGLTLHPENIGEAKSHAHLILQATDLILGGMNFRLNDLHKIKPTNSYRRGKKTIAKEKVFKKISSCIREGYPHFNIGISTGVRGDLANRWKDPYRHWCFQPTNSKYDANAVKE